MKKLLKKPTKVKIPSSNTQLFKTKVKFNKPNLIAQKFNRKIMGSGFTLIELLVVIAVIAVILAVSMSNLIGARQRARDAKVKAELREMKTALRLYYNDYNVYPNSDSNDPYQEIYGCEGTGDKLCPGSCTTGEFAAGTGCVTLYTKRFPRSPNGTDFYWHYAQAAAGNDYCLWAPLENAGDSEIAASQARCASSCSGLCDSGVNYCQCAD